jgi:cell division protein FtsL
MMRVLNILVIAALVSAAAYVYKIKFESTRQAEHLAKVRMEIRQEQDAIASLRAEWSKLDTPSRIQALANRHLSLKPIDPRQFDALRNLPDRPPDLVPPNSADPIGSLLENPDVLDIPTGSIPTAPRAKR